MTSEAKFLNFPKDDLNMIPSTAIRDMLYTEASPAEYHQFLAELEEKEPRMSYWMSGARDADIANLAASFQNIYSHYPTLPLSLASLLLRTFIRGYMMAESKWKPEIDLNGEVPGKHYIPRPEDFI
jgi:hypothetical protein